MAAKILKRRVCDEYHASALNQQQSSIPTLLNLRKYRKRQWSMELSFVSCHAFTYILVKCIMFSSSKKKFMRRLGCLLGVASVLAVISAIVATTVIMAKFRMCYALFFSYVHYCSLF